MKLLKTVAIASLVATSVTIGSASADQKFVTIGTGGQTGVYYVVGGSICRLVNRGSKDHKIKCTHTTGGSVKNLNGVRGGDLDFGVAQSDWQHAAYHGTNDKVFPQGAYPELRAVFAVHYEPFTLVARADSGINSFADLKGKRVNIGDPGSGQRGTMETLMEKYGWDKSAFKLASELKSTEHSQAICDNKIDAFIHTTGHPSGNINEAATSCDVKLVPVTGDIIDKLVADNAYYSVVTLPGGMYKGTDGDVETFGVGATFVSSTATSEDVVYEMVKAVFENFKRFKKLHPAFEGLKPEEMIVNNLSAPLHDGAVKYYKEKGWM